MYKKIEGLNPPAESLFVRICERQKIRNGAQRSEGFFEYTSGTGAEIIQFSDTSTSTLASKDYVETGTDSNDVINFSAGLDNNTPGNDTFLGNGGNDTIYGYGGNA